MAARLEFDITGSTAGLSKSVTAAIGLLNKLQAAGDKLDLFKNASQGVSGLSGAVGGLTSQVNTLTSAVRKGSQAWNDRTAQNALDTLNSKLLAVNGNQQLFGSSIANSQAALRTYQTALNSLLSAGVSPLDSRIQTLKNSIDSTTESIARQKAALPGVQNAYNGIGSQLTSVIGGYVSLYAAIRGVQAIVSSNAEISDSLADVRRTASLTIPQVEALFQALKKIDTRTSLKGLVDIAVIGGQLGIATDQLAGFTKATDQLNVALGGEIKGGPDEIAKSLGILNNVFGISAKNGGDVEKSFNQIGSVILGLGQSGLATGDFLSDFGQRVGGIAAQAKLSLPILLSYGAVLQEQGVTAEVAGTAFKKLLGSLATKRSDFFAVAQIADSKLTLQQFTDLINNDTQGALSKFFDGLAKGGPTTTQFQDLLKGVGLDAARSGQAITALALHQQDLTKHIAESTKEFQDGTLAAQQFQVKNDTLGASVDKLGKSFVSLTTSGGLASFFKFITDALGKTITDLDRTVNSKSWKEFFYAGAGIAGKFDQEQADANKAIQANSRGGKINSRVQAFKALPTQAAQSQAIGTQQGLRDFAKQIADQTGATRKQITAYNDEQKVLILLRQTYKDLYDTKKTTGTTETPDADLKTTKAIRARIAALQNDALANPGNKDEDIQRIQALTARLRELSGAAKGATSALGGISISNQLDDILNKTTAAFDQSGLKGYQLQLQKINDEYTATIANLNQLATKNGIEVKSGRISPTVGASNASKVQTDIDAATKLRDQQLSDARIGEANRVANEVQRINDEFGVKSQTGRDKELAAIQKMYDAEVVKAQGKAAILASLDAGRTSAIQAVADKYAAIQADLYDKINTINDTANAAISGKEASQTQKIVNEWEARRKAANGYYDELIKLNAGNNVSGNVPSVAQGLQGINAARLANNKAGTNAAITKGETESTKDVSSLSTVFNKTFDQSIRQLGNSFSNTITSIGQEGNRTFGEIFQNLQKDISKSLVSTLVKFGTDYLGDALKKGITNGTGNLADIFKNGISAGTAAGLGLTAAGALVSGVTAKTSSVGQGLGGALSGAGAGALAGSVVPGIGTVVGGVVGGVVGLAGGLFGAKGARKKEKALQEQQLEEAKKQTALLRQQQQAYTSSIIGRMTSSGTITSVDIDGGGKLVAEVDGKKLQFILDRTSNGR